VTTLTVDHQGDHRDAVSAADRQQTTTDVVTAAPLSSSPAAAAASATTYDASKHRSSLSTDNAQRIVSLPAWARQ